MAKEIKISIKSGFDPSGVADASRSIARLRDNLLTSNAELSAAIHNRAAEVAVGCHKVNFVPLLQHDGTITTVWEVSKSAKQERFYDMWKK